MLVFVTFIQLLFFLNKQTQEIGSIVVLVIGDLGHFLMYVRIFAETKPLSHSSMLQ